MEYLTALIIVGVAVWMFTDCGNDKWSVADLTQQSSTNEDKEKWK